MSDDIRRLAEKAISDHKRMVFDQYGRAIEEGSKIVQGNATIRRISTQKASEALQRASQVQRAVSESSGRLGESE